LESSRVQKKILLGKRVTNGIGAGADPSVGMAAAKESLDEIEEMLRSVHMVFITAGMGGGTGTGAAPIIAQKAREMDILVVAIVTKPFTSEGNMRMQLAEQGIAELKKHVDTLIVVPNQNLFRLANHETKMQDSLMMINNVLKSGVKGIVDLITKSGFINLDFADVKSIMRKRGKAMMGTGEASGPNRAIKAVEEAIANPLLDNVSIKSAKGIIINITSSINITLFEHEEAANKIKEEINNDMAQIIVGSVFDEEMGDTIRVSIFATGIDEESEDVECGGGDRRVVEKENGNIERAGRRVLSDDIDKKRQVEGRISEYERYTGREVGSDARSEMRQNVSIGSSFVKTKSNREEEDDAVSGNFFDMGEAITYNKFVGLNSGREKMNVREDDREYTVQNRAVENNTNIAKTNNGVERKRGFFGLFGKKNDEIKIISHDDLENDELDFAITNLYK
jgi:cell division protein FtsZ